MGIALWGDKDGNLHGLGTDWVTDMVRWWWSEEGDIEKLDAITWKFEPKYDLELTQEEMDRKFGSDWKMRLMIQDLEDQTARK
jgi:hypothetical protein